MNFPNDLDNLKQRVQNLLEPIGCAIENDAKAEKNFLLAAERTNAGRNLPPYYLVYFLFVDLLGYKNLGQFEKIAWSVPIAYKGTAYLLEHRKFGMGLFASDGNGQEKECQEIVEKIRKAVEVARPYFEWIAKKASQNSELNVINHSARLYDRYAFFLKEWKKRTVEADSRKNEVIKTQNSESSWSIYAPYSDLKRESEWLSLSAIDAFYSFTEHVFVHAGILKGNFLTGEAVADLADEDWPSKFKACLDIHDRSIRPHYDRLVDII